MAQYMFHMCPADTWASLKQTSTNYYPPTYEADGFIHLTADPSLLLQVGNHFYKGDPGKWILLVIDSSKLSSEVRIHHRSPPPQTLFKHLEHKILSLHYSNRTVSIYTGKI